jgi:hypothetical protein
MPNHSTGSSGMSSLELFPFESEMLKVVKAGVRDIYDP